jgi:hypothetical protein
MRRFFRRNLLALIARGHEAVNDYTYMFGLMFIVVRSAPNYCDICGNLAGVFTVTEDGVHAYTFYGPMPEEWRKKPGQDVPARYFE